MTTALKSDVAHAVQEAIVETLVVKAVRALEQTGLEALVVSGGVSANRTLRARLAETVGQRGGRVYYPRIEFCTDNAAMIAVAGLARLSAGQHDTLAIRARAKWDLNALRATSQGDRAERQTHASDAPTFSGAKRADKKATHK
jgi:N6-L-threonylcarbamoyladenine synthase